MVTATGAAWLENAADKAIAKTASFFIFIPKKLTPDYAIKFSGSDDKPDIFPWMSQYLSGQREYLPESPFGWKMIGHV